MPIHLARLIFACRLFGMVLAFALAGSAAASDRAREKRWADEIIPTIVVGDPVWLKSSEREFLGLYTQPAGAKAGVVLAHGVGVHPDHGLIGSLRTRLADAGFATLSVQMPIAAAQAGLDDYYPKLFPEAGQRLAAAASFLESKGIARIALVSHSMGAWMANVYLDRADATRYQAWVSMGVTGAYTTRLMGLDLPWLRVTLPILDVYGGADDRPGVTSSAPRRASAIAGTAGSKQVRIEGADHFFAGKEAEVTRHIAQWLGERWR